MRWGRGRISTASLKSMSVYQSTCQYTRVHVSIPEYMSVNKSMCRYTSVLLWPRVTRMPSRILSTPVMLSAVGNASSGTAKPPWSN